MSTDCLSCFFADAELLLPSSRTISSRWQASYELALAEQEACRLELLANCPACVRTLSAMDAARPTPNDHRASLQVPEHADGELPRTRVDP